MKSTMTEREFLERFKFRRERGLEGEQIALQVAKKAGLEFAPESVKLPDTLIAGTGSLNPVGRPWHSMEEVVAGFQAAAARYNAYPGLRAQLRSQSQLIEKARAEGVAARQEEIRQALLAEADRESEPLRVRYPAAADPTGSSAWALRRFARTLEVPTP